jgi:hypothetical protein
MRKGLLELRVAEHALLFALVRGFVLQLTELFGKLFGPYNSVRASSKQNLAGVGILLKLLTSTCHPGTKLCFVSFTIASWPP